MSILIQNGILVLPTGPIQADLRVAGGRIAELGPGLAPGASRVIDAQERLVFPGFIDTHTHFEMNKGFPNETADDWYTGTRAALAGGTTTVLDFAEPERGATLASALETWHGRADGAACCNYGFHMTVKDWSPSIRSELREMTAAGVTSYKVYLAYDNLRLSDAAAYEVVKAVGAEGGVVGCHCENGDLVTEGIRAQQAAGNLSPAAHPLSRPPAVEAEAVGRWLTIAELAGCPVNIVHLSTLRGLEAVRAARTRGQRLYVETCPQYLLLDESVYFNEDYSAAARYVCAPPLRDKAEQEHLWKGLRRGAIQTVSTDHCSFTLAQKDMGREDFTKIPGGLPGVETRGELLYSYGVAKRKISAAQMCRVLSENPARLYGLYPRKGVLRPGSDADIVVYDPGASHVIRAEDCVANVDYNPYEGFVTAGGIRQVWLRGQLSVENGKVLVEAPAGKYMARGKNSL